MTQLGTYRHYKGGTYTLILIARNSENRQQRMAVYCSHLTEEVWVRPLRMWRETVEWPDGVKRLRFEPEYPEASWNLTPDFFPPQEPESWKQQSPPEPSPQPPAEPAKDGDLSDSSDAGTVDMTKPEG